MVLSVGFPFAMVGPRAVGGAEVVLSEIERGLSGLGFRSVVVAREGSTPAGQLYATPVPAGEIDDAVRAQVETAQQANIDRALAEHPIALVHLHGLDFQRYRFPADLPVIVTLHLPPAWYPEAIWHLPAGYQLICVSETQRAACPESARSQIEVIGNGVPLPDRTSLRLDGGRYALMLSRICPEKNLHTGFEAARLAGVSAILGGEVFPYREHLRYFAEEIEPRLTAPVREHTPRSRSSLPAADARFLGPVTGHAKVRLLSRAACLLLPSLAPETSSLVAMEALAAGVPVVAVASGAVPEIVEHGRTGLLVSAAGDVAAHLATALRQSASLDRLLCRQTAEARFSVEKMLEAYAALYRRLARPHPMQTKAPAQVPSSVRNVERSDAEPRHEVKTMLLPGIDALESLQSAWEELWQADPTATPFQHPAWLLPWARQFGPDGVVQTIEQRDGRGRLLGLLPLFSYQEPLDGTHKTLLLGTGTTDYLGGTFGPADATFLAGQALTHSSEVLPTNSRLEFLQLRSDSPLLQAGASLSKLHESLAEPCAVLATAPALPPKVGANVRRYRRRAEAQGVLNFAVASNPSQVAIFFDELVNLHSERWQARQETGVLSDPRVVQHHLEAMPALLAAGLLQLFRLRCGQVTVAVLYALGDSRERPIRRLHLYLIGIDIRRIDISPGTLILHSVLEYARQHGFAELDLLRGGERYKELWGALSTPTYALRSD